MIRVLLFGASGFIGRHVRANLIPEADLICPPRAEYDLISADIPALTELIAKVRPTAVVSCAGRVAGAGPDLVAAHAGATGKLIEAIAAGAPTARLVRLGSAAEYGLLRHGHAVRETDPTRPVSEYGVSQLAATQLIEIAAATGRVDAVVLRVFNPVGPGLPETNVLGRAARLLRETIDLGTGQLTLGLLDTFRDFVDVRDVARAVRAVLRTATLPERVYNVASGTAVSTRCAVRLLAQAAGFDGEFRDGALTPSAARSAGVPWMRGDISRATRDLGWTPEYNLADAVGALWAGTGKTSWSAPALVRPRANPLPRHRPVEEKPC
jgi:nucleoside-diphosphate-sugar epimerase